MTHDDALRDTCREAARRLLARKGWELVEDEAEFVIGVVRETTRRQALIVPGRQAQKPLSAIIEDATVNCYGHVWHAACRAHGTPRQRRAFTELYEHLLPAAVRTAGGDQRLAEESTQEALISVWKNLNDVRDAGSFLSWSWRIVTREVQSRLRRNARQLEINESELLHGDEKAGGPGLERIADQELVSTGSAPLNQFDAVRAQLEGIVRHCLTKHRFWQEVIVRLFLLNKSVKQVADELDIKPNYVYVLTNRARKELRRCKEMQDFARSAGGTIDFGGAGA
jgi:RNA polymerase sigma factor (sigma-70 family)